MIDIQEQRYHEMLRDGREVLTPEENELLLDCDWGCDEEAFISRLSKLLSHFKMIEDVTRAAYTKSETPGHWHARVSITHPLTFPERQMYELMLGSDPKRAVWNIQHWRNRSLFPELLTTKSPEWKEIR